MEKQKGFLEESLAESQGKEVCRALFDGSPDAIFLADPRTGIIIDANPAAELLIGRPLDEIIGLHQTALHPKKKKEASRRIFREHSSSEGETVSSGPEPHYALRSDGTEVPIEITAKIIKIKGRRVLQGFFRDVSARKAAERALRESEERYRTLVNHAPIGIVVHREGVMRFANRWLAWLAGLQSPAMLAGRRIMDFVHQDFRALAAERLNALNSTRKPLPPAEIKLVAPDGKVFDMEMNSIPITYEGKDCIMSIIQDITARKGAQDALRESEELYRTLVNHAPAGIVVHSMGVMRFINSKMAEMVRIAAPEEAIGRNVMEFMHPEYRQLVRERIQKAMSEGRAMPPAEEKLVAADETELFVEIRSVPITYRSEPCVMAIVQDISERKQSEEKLRTAHLKLVEANMRLEERVQERTAQLAELNKELEAFSYSAAHDLKAPLRRINVFSDMLEKEAGTVLSDGTHEHLLNIHKSVIHMTRLVDGLLKLSTTGRRQLEPEKVNLSAVLQEAVADVMAENPGRRIDWCLQKLPEAKCDRAMLRQVFVNLLGNAAKYSRNRDTTRIEVMYSCTGREHVIAVRDNGVGFSMEYADKLFGVFQRLHHSADFEGTGIGLSMIKRIISRHGGRVWAESRPDKGATFYFTLPA